MNPNDPAHLEKLRRLMPEILTTARGIRGFLTEKEMKFLATMAACPTADGVILEIGSFQGKSTSILGLAGQLAPGTQVVAVDPLDYRPSHDPKIGKSDGKSDVAEEFWKHLRQAKVDHLVEFNRMRSQELAPKWPAGRKIRFHWIDGDHYYPGAKDDFDLYYPHLADGAIVALHDCFKHDPGPMRVMAEDILLSPHFGATGACGSIGWGQYRSDPKDAAPFLREKLKFYSRVARLIPHAALDHQDHRTSGPFYKVLRSRIPHGELNPADFVKQVALCAKQ
ncbi:MAG: class I SAM-dependent methyltransferase [Verrucomicrobia bacterium]|nr:class I SAM-dependent methyltransferase [Verrucomicrobiota bacterium]